jgi:hypothetical protein
MRFAFIDVEKAHHAVGDLGRPLPRWRQDDARGGPAQHRAMFRGSAHPSSPHDAHVLSAMLIARRSDFGAVHAHGHPAGDARGAGAHVGGSHVRNGIDVCNGASWEDIAPVISPSRFE